MNLHQYSWDLSIIWGWEIVLKFFVSHAKLIHRLINKGAYQISIKRLYIAFSFRLFMRRDSYYTENIICHKKLAWRVRILFCCFFINQARFNCFICFVLCDGVIWIHVWLNWYLRCGSLYILGARVTNYELVLLFSRLKHPSREVL